MERAYKGARIIVRVESDYLEQAKSHAESRGQTLSAFVLRAMSAQMARDNLEDEMARSREMARQQALEIVRDPSRRVVVQHQLARLLMITDGSIRKN